MITALAAALMAAMGESGVIWLNACDVPAEGIAVSVAGTYKVWLWAPENQETGVTIAGRRLEGKCPADKDKKSIYAWFPIGAVELKTGPAALELAPNVAGIALSQKETFDPRAAMGDMRVLNTGDSVHDRRAQSERHTDTVFTMPVFHSREEWEAAAHEIRQRILLSSGLVPLPEKTPLNAHVFGRIERGDYSVEKVWFEARPGFLVTGNLYRPLGKPGPFPGVVNPHGHWEHGRLNDDARGSVPGRCITLARMGMVAFSHDMIGYNDSAQFAHNWGKREWKLWGIHPFAFQLWSGIRAVDFLQSLPDVDPERIGCTGASGGGTQTFALTAVDPRIRVAAPVNMISHSMQGGCLCENAPIIRFDNSNMEIGALAAPRPLLMVSATGDWTRETPRVEFPSIRDVYALYDAGDRVENVHIDSDHNYNKQSREAMYRFFGKWLLNEPERYAKFEEPAFTVENTDDLRVFPDKKLPDGLPSFEAIVSQTILSTKAKWDAILPKNKSETAAFKTEYGDSIKRVLGARIPDVNDLECERTGFEERRGNGYVVERWILSRRAVGDAVPALLYRAYGPEVQDAVLIVHGQGKAALANMENGGPGPLVSGLIARGKAVLTMDAFLLGEHISPLRNTPPRVTGQFHDTFQPTDTACRVQDVLTALAYLRSRRDLSGTVDLVGLDAGGIWSLFAAAIDDHVRRVVIDGARFDVNDDAMWETHHYMPCIRAIGDVHTAAALVAPRPMILCNAAPSMIQAVQQRYEVVDAASLSVIDGPATPEVMLAGLD
ncbi:MAG TPA: acetylxylan esterase [Candidatus Hydrogenedentes bacterium]|nr:acetylxylan esterase [Candidatus Hydrogenedentota bacterium]HRT19351.1 acetylxylan esterase [Candidatus Hydrogenedentota bacterium]HRT63915.1 acetylxylan esterase [Candidatus Hydrogenedentota bacterium]